MKKREYISPMVDVDEMRAEALLTTLSTSSEVDGAVGAKPHDSEPPLSPAERSTFSLWEEGE